MVDGAMRHAIAGREPRGSGIWNAFFNYNAFSNYNAFQIGL